jgi:regulator of protease activity HflC (stomatin/prohibitin superfamily)
MELKVNQLDRNTDGDIVTTVHWTATKADGEFTASSYGTVGVEVGDTVIPFADLTEEVVKTWLAEKLDLVAMEASLDAQIEAQKNPVTATGLPW